MLIQKMRCVLSSVKDSRFALSSNVVKLTELVYKRFEILLSDVFFNHIQLFMMTLKDLLNLITNRGQVVSQKQACLFQPNYILHTGNYSAI